jgi:DNA modification methylase
LFSFEMKDATNRDRAKVLLGDCRELLRDLPDECIDAIVTDPPYELGFMGKRWDASGIAYNVDVWRECLRVLKPGGHLLAFGGTRTYHRMACAIEDAGFEVRDSIHWIYGSGFPKSLDVSKAIDKAAGAEREVGQRKLTGTARIKGGQGGATSGDPSRLYATNEIRDTLPITAPATDAARQWQGWGTALKPAHEPIVVARKPLDGTVSENVLAHGTGAINVDACRVGTSGGGWNGLGDTPRNAYGLGWKPDGIQRSVNGRWPANIVLDEDAGRELDEQSGGASRFFYCAKASKSERGEGNTHPTVKPVSLMRWLVRLVTPPNGIVLDPFTGSGTTGVASVLESFQFIGCEQSEEYANIANSRIGSAIGEQLSLAVVR